MILRLDLNPRCGIDLIQKNGPSEGDWETGWIWPVCLIFSPGAEPASGRRRAPLDRRCRSKGTSAEG